MGAVLGSRKVVVRLVQRAQSPAARLRTPHRPLPALVPGASLAVLPRIHPGLGLA
jgi:hypothetical protein